MQKAKKDALLRQRKPPSAAGEDKLLRKHAPPAAAGGSAAGAASPGDEVLLHCIDGREYAGVLLPENPQSPQAIILKLPSGYNIGVEKSKVEKIGVARRMAVGAAKPRAQAPPPAEGIPISILGCGGTIAARIDYRTGAVHPAVSSEDLLSGIPSVPGIRPQAKTLFSLLSEDTSPSHWVEIARACAKEIKAGAQGIVVTHGTDTMSYTSAALSFMLRAVPCPVILTGSQRSSDRGSSDADLNVRASLAAAKADLSGVFVCMHENLSDESCLLHFGTKVRKMHTSRRDAFRSIGVMPAARVFPSSGEMEKLSQNCQPRKEPSDFLLDAKLNPNVALLYTYPGIRPDRISSLSKYDGVVIAGTGLGHIPANAAGDKMALAILPEVKELISSGIPVVIAPQTIYGRINMDVYSNGRLLRGAGAIGHMCDFTPECAYVKLMWVLGHEKKMARVKEMMETDVAGEITARSELSGY